MKFLRRIPFHPLLLSLFPALALLANNIDQVKPSAAWRSLWGSLTAAIVLFLLLQMLLRDWRRAALVCTLALVLFFSYGHVNQVLKLSGSPGMLLARHRYMLPLWIAAFGFGSWRLLRYVHKPDGATMMLNLAALLVVLMPLAKMGVFAYRTQAAQVRFSDAPPEAEQLQLPEDEPPPDIYYIVLDAYTRQDILQEVFDYNNSPFLDALTEMGFYVARCSQSNYSQTQLSLASSLNMDYLDALGGNFVGDTRDHSDLWPLLRHGEVRSKLEDLGYTIVAFETGYYWIMWMDADVYLSPPRQGSNSALFVLGGLNGFEAMFIRSTAALALTDAALKFDLLERLLPDLDYPRRVWRERTLFTLEQLEYDKVPSIQGPKFTYAHLILPHFPYVFGPNGEYIQERLPNMDIAGYRNQVIFANKQIESLVRDILTRSERAPVIVLQGDHGLRNAPKERVAILNAYYLPDGGSEQLYATITPVNTFRMIFDTYLGGDYGLLEDISYYSDYDHPYVFQEVPFPESSCVGEAPGDE